MGHSIRHQLKQSRAFFFALVAVAVVWIVTAMAEEKRFRESYPITYDNIDTAKYAIIHSDSVITIDISSNGFNAFGRARSHSQPSRRALHFDLSSLVAKHKNDSNFSITLRTDEYLDIIKEQLDMRGVSDVSLVSEQISLQVAIREHKAFVPDISRVSFSFDKMAGLNGEPTVTPDSIYLYGSHESLAKIEKIAAKEQIISDINTSGEYRIALEEDWKRYPDLRISNEEVVVSLPVEKFIEKSVILPIEITDKSGNSQWNLYPANVTVKLLVPESKAETLDLSKCVVNASAKECKDNQLIPKVTKFPSCVRVKSITPEQVQYLIIEQ